MTVRNVAFIGLLGIGIAASGCTNTAPPPAADTSAASQAQPPADTNPPPQPATDTTPAPQPAANANPAPVRRSVASAPSAPAPAPVNTVQPAAPANYADTAPPQEIVVETAPPPERVERVVERPGYVWTPGYWRWDANARRDVWVGGAYVADRPGFTWMPGRWSPGPNHTWRFRGGYWAQRGAPGYGQGPGPGPRPGQGAGPRPGQGQGAGPGGNSNFPNVAPPAPRIEAVVARPGQVWTPGYWNWEGNHYVWTGGAYVRAHPGWNWIRAQWAQGPNGGWHLQQGHWQQERR